MSTRKLHEARLVDGSVMRLPYGSQPRKVWPRQLHHPEMVGVFVGGCVERGVGSSFRASAHAHTAGKHRGWICFRSFRTWSCPLFLLHELAHIVTREGHTANWRAYLQQIGGTLDPVYGFLRSYHPVRVRGLTNEGIVVVETVRSAPVATERSPSSSLREYPEGAIPGAATGRVASAQAEWVSRLLGEEF